MKDMKELRAFETAWRFEKKEKSLTKRSGEK